MKKIYTKTIYKKENLNIKKDLILAITNWHGKDIRHLSKIRKIKSMMDTTFILFSKGKITNLIKENEVTITDSHNGKLPFDDTTTINLQLWRSNIRITTLTYNPLIKFRKEE